MHFDMATEATESITSSSYFRRKIQNKLLIQNGASHSRNMLLYFDRNTLMTRAERQTHIPASGTGDKIMGQHILTKYTLPRKRTVHAM
jgi:hypothetical protein